jgi:hypothetical protein
MVQFELTPEQQQRKETVRRFAAEEIIPVAAKYDEQQIFPEDLARKAWEVGLMDFRRAGRVRWPGPEHLPARRRRVHAESPGIS